MSHTLCPRLAILVLLLATTVEAPALTPPTTPVGPRYEVIDALGSIDVYKDIAVDPAGSRPAVLYYDTTSADAVIPKPNPLKLARYDRFSWVSRTLGLVNRRDSSVDERSIRLAIDLNGAAHAIAIESNDAGAADDALIYFGEDAQGATVREQIDVGGILEIALAVDTVAEPYIAYTKGSGTLVIRRRANGAWQEIALSPTPTNARYPSFAPYPAEANFLAMHLAWAEYTTHSSVLRHAFVSTLSATADTIASSASPHSLTTPQLVVDRFGNLEVAYVSWSAGTQSIELRRRVSAQSSWDCIDTGCSLPTGPLAPGFSLPVHGYVQGAVNYLDANYVWKTLRREGAGWVSYVLANVTTATGAALDRHGNVYTMGGSRDTHRDLLAVRIGGPWESRGRIPFDTSVGLSNPLDVASDALGHPIVYARRSCCVPDPRGALWLIGEGDDFVEYPLPGTFTAQDASIAVAPDGVVHVAIYDGDQDDLLHAAFTPSAGGGSWAIETVESLGDVGLSPTMLIGKDGTPMIVYRLRPNLMFLAARAPNGAWTFRTLASSVYDGAHPVAVASREAHIAHVSWFDGEPQRLRITTVRRDPLADSFVTTESIPTPTGRVRGRVHDIALLGDGGVAVAYSDEIPGQAQLGYLYRDFTGQWFDPGEQPEPFGSGEITRIALDNTLLAPGGARVAWVMGGRLHYAEKHLGLFQWESEDLGSLTPTAPLHLGAAGPLRLTYGEGSGLFMLQRLEALGADDAIEVFGRPVGGGFGYCACLLIDDSILEDRCNDDLKRHSVAAAPAPKAKGSDPDRPAMDVLTDLRRLFSTTPAGRYYLQLFAAHAAEIIPLTLSDPEMLLQRTRTLSDLLPGLSALVDSPSRGAEFRFKPEQIANARAVVEGWAEAGSPALAAAVANELARTNNFELFTGMTFTQWFNSISADTDSEGVFDDGFE